MTTRICKEFYNECTNKKNIFNIKNKRGKQFSISLLKNDNLYSMLFRASLIAEFINDVIYDSNETFGFMGLVLFLCVYFI